jgi:hypothetical protein
MILPKMCDEYFFQSILYFIQANRLFSHKGNFNGVVHSKAAGEYPISRGYAPSSPVSLVAIDQITYLVSCDSAFSGLAKNKKGHFRELDLLIITLTPHNSLHCNRRMSSNPFSRSKPHGLVVSAPSDSAAFDKLRPRASRGELVAGRWSLQKRFHGLTAQHNSTQKRHPYSSGHHSCGVKAIIKCFSICFFPCLYVL